VCVCVCVQVVHLQQKLSMATVMKNKLGVETKAEKETAAAREAAAVTAKDVAEAQVRMSVSYLPHWC
jgi:hypothetical protein